MAKILVVENGKNKLLEEKRFPNESLLQDYLEKFPKLIPLEEVMEDESRFSLLPIGREVSIPSGSIDLLFLDTSGLLTLVETKVVKNPESRREVIGQIIEYASCVSEWTFDDIEIIANNYFSSGKTKYKGLNIYEAVQRLAKEQSFSVEQFKFSVEKNLTEGKLRLIIAIDEIIEPLKQTVTFLNSHSTFNILLLQLKCFMEGENKLIFTPSIYPQKALEVSKRRKWDEQSFFIDLERKCEKDVVAIIKELYEFTKNEADSIWWGTGISYASFTFHIIEEGQIISIFTVSSTGRLQLNFGWMKEKVKIGILEDFRKLLNAINGIRISEEAVSLAKWPSIDIKVLTNEDNLKYFKVGVESLIQALKEDEN